MFLMPLLSGSVLGARDKHEGRGHCPGICAVKQRNKYINNIITDSEKCYKDIKTI